MGSGGAPFMITALVSPGSLRAGATLVLDDTESHHLRVRRARAGEPVRLVDGAGETGLALLRSTGKAAAVEVQAVEPVPRPVPLLLAAGAGDRDRFGWMVEKATELGATGIVPVDSERAGDVATRLRPGQVQRLARRALEAMKQCGGAWAPEVRAPVALAQLLAEVDQPVRWLGAAGGGATPGSLPADPAVILIGPEGGWSEAEAASIAARGFEPVCFGPHVLRFETAALAGIALLQAARTRKD